MSEKQKQLLSYFGVALVLLVVGGLIGFSVKSVPVGNAVHNVQETFDAGLAVNGTEVVNSSGVWVGALSGTTGALSSTLAVTGASTLSSSLTLAGNLAVSSTLFNVLSATTGRVGVGTSSPAFKFVVDGGSATSSMQIGGMNSKGTCVVLGTWDGTKVYLSVTSTPNALTPWTALSLSTTACN